VESVFDSLSLLAFVFQWRGGLMVFYFLFFHLCFFTKISTIKAYQAPAHTRAHTHAPTNFLGGTGLA